MARPEQELRIKPSSPAVNAQPPPGKGKKGDDSPPQEYQEPSLEYPISISLLSFVDGILQLVCPSSQ